MACTADGTYDYIWEFTSEYNENIFELQPDWDYFTYPERIYVYEGVSEIERIELDLDNTAVTITSGSGTSLSINVLENYIYTEDGNIFCIDYSDFFADYGVGYYSEAPGPRVSGVLGWKIYFSDGSVDTDTMEINIYGSVTCLAEGTQITLADRTTKAIEDITYEDELLVWDFDKGEFAIAKPLWIKKKQVASRYNLLKFDNGSELKTIDQHRIFNKNVGRFTYPMTDETPVGTTTFTDAGTEAKLVSKEEVIERVNYYNIITDYHMNLFANGILTSCRLSNLYKIKDMKYEKDNRKLVSKDEYPNVPEEYYKGLRLAEQPREINKGNDVRHSDDMEGYVQNLINLEKEV